jgi:hypothetical protein
MHCRGGRQISHASLASSVFFTDFGIRSAHGGQDVVNCFAFVNCWQCSKDALKHQLIAFACPQFPDSRLVFDGC